MMEFFGNLLVILFCLYVASFGFVKMAHWLIMRGLGRGSFTVTYKDTKNAKD